jgi:hypothetical protein
MKIFILSLIILLSSSVFADCMTDFRHLQDKKSVKFVKERTIEILSKRQLQFLTAPEGKAVSDYIQLLDFTFDGDNGLRIVTHQYQDRKTGFAIAYRISITDGTEYSLVKYTLKIGQSEGGWIFPVLHRLWENRTRVSDFICE